MTYTLQFHVSASGPTTFSTAARDSTSCDLLIVSLTSFQSNIATLSDSKGNTWTGLTAQTYSGGVYQRIYYCQPDASHIAASHTFTETAVGNFYGTLNVLGFSGSLASAFDLENGTSGTGFSTGNTKPGSIAILTDNELVICGISFDSSQSLSIDSGFTISDQANYSGGNNFGGGAAYKIQTAHASENPSWTVSGTIGAGIAIASFKSSAAFDPSASRFPDDYGVTDAGMFLQQYTIGAY